MCGTWCGAPRRWRSRTVLSRDLRRPGLTGCVLWGGGFIVDGDHFWWRRFHYRNHDQLHNHLAGRHTVVWVSREKQQPTLSWRVLHGAWRHTWVIFLLSDTIHTFTWLSLCVCALQLQLNVRKKGSAGCFILGTFYNSLKGVPWDDTNFVISFCI